MTPTFEKLLSALRAVLLVKVYEPEDKLELAASLATEQIFEAGKQLSKPAPDPLIAPAPPKERYAKHFVIGLELYSQPRPHLFSSYLLVEELRLMGLLYIRLFNNQGRGRPAYWEDWSFERLSSCNSRRCNVDLHGSRPQVPKD